MATTAELIAQADEDLANLSTGDLIKIADRESKPAEQKQSAAPKSNLRDDVTFLGSEKLGKAASALFPKTAKATAEGKGYGGKLLGSSQDVASPLRALRVLLPEVQTRDASGKMVNAKGESLPESYKDRLKMAGEKVASTQGPLADPGLVPALAAGVLTGGAPLLAQGAAAGLASAAGHQAENVSEGRGFKPGQAVGEIALSALIPQLLKSGGTAAKKKAVQIIQTAFKAGKRVGGEKVLSPALAETALQKYGSLKGTEGIAGKLSSVHDDINRQFENLMKGPAKNKQVDVRAALNAADNRVDRLAKTMDLKLDEVASIKSTINKWREFFGSNADDLMKTAGQAKSELKLAQGAAQTQAPAATQLGKEAEKAAALQAKTQSQATQAASQASKAKRQFIDVADQVEGSPRYGRVIKDGKIVDIRPQRDVLGQKAESALEGAQMAASKAREAATQARAKLAVNEITQGDFEVLQAAANAAEQRASTLSVAARLQQGESLDQIAKEFSQKGMPTEEIVDVLKAARASVEGAKAIPGTLVKDGTTRFPQAQKFKVNTLDEAANYAKVPAAMRAPELGPQAAAGRIARRKLSSAMTKVEPQLAPLNEKFKEVASIEPFVEQALERQAANRGFSLQDLVTMGLLPSAGAGAAYATDRPELAALGALPLLISRGQKSPAAATALYRAGSQLAQGPGALQIAIANLLRTYGGRGSEGDSTEN